MPLAAIRQARERIAGRVRRTPLLPRPALHDGLPTGLRLKLENFNRLKLHFFHEQAGATFIYYEDQGYRWAAYATTREAGKPAPKTWAMTATDDDRCRRSELRYGGPIELRYREGEVILSRGDIVLLAAPTRERETPGCRPCVRVLAIWLRRVALLTRSRARREAGALRAAAAREVLELVRPSREPTLPR